jgi:GH24 family phage-related lysozyme (muramidase)
MDHIMPPYHISPELREQLETLKGTDFENNISFMYVDSTGNVTVGVGHNLTADPNYQAQPFKINRELDPETKKQPRRKRHAVKGGDIGISLAGNRPPGAAATPDEIKNDFDFLTKHSGKGESKGHGLKKYSPDQSSNNKQLLKRYTTLELDDDDIEKLFQKDCDSFISELRGVRLFGTAFDDFPVEGQAALIDMIFNLGSPTFRRLFSASLIAAIKGEGKFAKLKARERWNIAAAHSGRQVPPKRNQQVSDWFKSAAVNKKFAADDSK